MASRKSKKLVNKQSPPDSAVSGIAEFDSILRGGFPRNRMCLLQGPPGSGKTTLALQFLLAGAQQGEKGAYITFSETDAELRQSAKSHGWSLKGLSVIDLTTMSDELGMEKQYTVLHPADVELAETSTELLQKIKELRPRRLVLDSLSELRMVARDPLRYRRQILALKQALSKLGCTVLFLDDQTSETGADLLLQSIAHGVVQLTSEETSQGALHRRVRVTKMRGVPFIEGAHDFRIATGGIKVFPRLAAAGEGFREGFNAGPALASGIKELDELMGGPIPWGFGVMIVGPPGIGKSSLAAQLAASAARHGKRVCMYSFEESLNTFLSRCGSLGIDIAKNVKRGLVELQRVDPSHITPGQVIHNISTCIEKHHAGVVIIDSLNGYLQAMSSDRSFIVHLHELLAYLNARGVITILVSTQHGFVNVEQSSFEATYLADLVILLRYFESLGTVRQAISIVKNRSQDHERTIREFEVGKNGIRIGKPLTEFQGVLTGNPEYSGKSGTLIRDLDERTEKS
ncbi:MAG TPA: ATPase domain-containing protein [Terriglobales bacterium]|jgi:circadian clock protein KaiC|nr:ATPase domain-containing protein [Terriglobales bacterium]